MREIMISIQPQWVEKILNKEKTIEIRKTMPKCELPCKVYIYMTKKRHFFIANRKGEEIWYSDGLRYDKTEIVKFPKCDIQYWHLLGKVVAEFTLNKVTKHEKNFIDCEDNICYNFKGCDVKKAGFETDCLSLIDFDNFVEDYGNGKTLYGWHIDNLKIYDKPKELSEFKHYKKYDWWDYGHHKNKPTYELESLDRPPQSWCYCEVLNDSMDN